MTYTDICQLFADYSYYNDRREFQRLMGLFDSTASISVTHGDLVQGPFEGHRTIEEYFRSATEGQPPARHLITNVRLAEVADDHARATAVLTLAIHTADGIQIAVTGEYRLTTAKVGGETLIKQLEVVLDG